MKSVIKSAKTVEEAVDLGLKDLGLTRDGVDIEVLEEAKSGFLGIFGSQDAIVKITEKLEFKIDINDIYGEKEAQEAKLAKEKQAQEEALRKAEQEKKEQAIKEENARKAEEARVAENKKRQEEQRLKEEAIKADQVKFAKAEKEACIQVESSDENEQVAVKVENLQTVSDKVQSSDELLDTVKTYLANILDSMHIKANINGKVENEILAFNLVDISEEDTGIIIGKKGETLDSLQYILSLMANKNSADYRRVTLDVANYRKRRKEAIENNAKKLAFKVIKSKRDISLEPMNSYERRIVHYALQNYKEVETVSQGNFPNRKVVIKYKG